MGAQSLGLRQYPVHFLKAQALLVAVLRRPAAGAVHIAGGGGIHENEPGNVDVILGGVGLSRLIAAEATLVGGIGQEGLEDVGVVFPNEPLGIVSPFALRVFCNGAQGVKGVVAPGALMDFLNYID